MPNNIEIYRGDNKTYEVTVVDSDGVAVDITSATIVFSVKASSTETAYKIQLTSDEVTQIEITDGAGGVFKIYLVPANTNSYTAVSWIYDVQLTIGGKVYTIIKSDFVIKADITRP